MEFTFHYGSILIMWGRQEDMSILAFTFHYGSILIGMLERIKQGYWNLHSTMVLF